MGDWKQLPYEKVWPFHIDELSYHSLEFALPLHNYVCNVFCQALFLEIAVQIPCFRPGNFPAFSGLIIMLLGASMHVPSDSSFLQILVSDHGGLIGQSWRRPSGHR